MNKNLIMLTLLGVTLSIGASDISVAPDFVLRWFDIPVSEKVKELFDKYLKNKKAGNNQAGNSDFDLKALDNALREDFNKTNLNNFGRFDLLADVFCYQLATADDGEKAEAKGKYLLSGTLGDFVGKMCKDLDESSEALMALNFRTKVALRNDGYYKEYFLGDQADTEKKDGIRQYFFSEPVQRPSGLLAALGFGYVDKRSWGKYLGRKALGVAVVGGAAALGYGAKRYYGSQPMPVEPEPERRGWFDKAGPEERTANEKIWATGDRGTVKSLTGLARRSYDATTGLARRSYDATIGATRRRNQRQYDREENLNNAHKQIAEIKKQEREQLKDVKKRSLPKQSFFSRFSRSKPQPVNPMGSQFDIEGGMPIGTTARKEYLELDRKRHLPAGTTEYQKNMEAMIKEDAKLKIDEVNRQHGLPVKK